MFTKNTAKLMSYSPFFAMILSVTVFLTSGQKAAAVTAEDVLNTMNADQRHGYLVGVVEGLATARWLQDKPDQTGMQCISNWYLQRPQSVVSNEIETWFARHPERQAGLLLSVLIKRECGE
ncbi:MAG: hypothetical protein ACRBBK_07310 [Paracoccaceae bacterium]